MLADRSTNLPGAGTQDPSSRKSAFKPADRLESWKEIAAYLKRDVRTVQRWEKREGLPIRRHQHDEGHTVYAYRAELDAWWGAGHFRLERGHGGKETEVAKEDESGAGVWRHWWLWLVIAAVAVVTSAVAIYLLKFQRSPRLALQQKDSILIANFENRTGDQVFDDTLRQGLAVQLAQSPFLYIVSNQQTTNELRFMKLPAGTLLTQDLARRVCERLDGAAVLSGSIAQIGSQYNLVLNAVNCDTGASLARVAAVANDKNHVLPALGTVATTMRKKLGESLSTVGKFNAPIEQVTTSSLEALKAYSLGTKALWADEGNAANSSFQHAIALDPNFAMAYARLGALWSGDSILATRYLTKAYSLRDRVSEVERFYISSHYEHIVTGDLQKARQIYELWAQTYPQDKVPVGNIGLIDSALGQYDEAVATLRQSLRMPPPTALDYGNLAECYIALNRLDDATATLREAKEHIIEPPVFHSLFYGIAFLRGNTAGMAREAAWASGKPGIEQHEHLLYLQSDTAACAGQMAKANDLTASAVSSAEKAGLKEIAADYLAEAALRAALVGDAAQARSRAQAGLKISDAPYTEAAAALAMALAGDAAQAQKLANDLARRFPEATLVQFKFLPEIRAAIALDRKASAKAIAGLQAALPYELGVQEQPIVLNLYTAYVRGLAYLVLHQGAPASAEFQKILNHPGVALDEIIVPLAHLGLARARALSGDKAGARKSCQAFFTLWKHADPDIPILRQAKAECAQLQ